MTDNASAMNSMVTELRNKGFFTKAIHMTCGAHKLHNLALKIKDEFKVLNKAMMSAKSLFVKSPKRRRFFKQEGFRLPPKPNHIRWGIWLKCVSFYVEESNIQSLIDGLKALRDSEQKAEVNGINYFDTNK